ncbi:unnamed protein product [Amoebophrya sp. A25]|nr:unnamed protein product [Amoebophrya sp. A25]|eukprot:GSA25T00020302001.1
MPYRVSFVVTPYFWQGSAFDASQRLRYCVRQGLRNCIPSTRAGDVGSTESSSGSGTSTTSTSPSSSTISTTTTSLPKQHTILVNHLAQGLYGYEPKAAGRVLLEECVEAMLRLDSFDYDTGDQLRCIKIVDKDWKAVRLLAQELQEVESLAEPSLRPQTAHTYYHHLFRKLIALPDQPNQFLRQNKVTFPLRHGIIRNKRQNYMHQIRPFLWRPQKVNQPPPLMVESGSGDPTSNQPSPRPHYERGVAFNLFPNTKISGFHAMRRSQTTGKWIGKVEHFRIRDHAHTSVVPGDGRCGRRWGNERT